MLPQKSETHSLTTPAHAFDTPVPSDVLIPRLLCLQAMSDLVKERKGQQGDLTRSTDARKLGDPEVPLTFIPLMMPKATWMKQCRPTGATRWEFRGIEPRNAANDGAPWRFNADKDGNPLAEGAPSSHEWRRVKCLTTYVILPQDIDADAAEQKKAQNGELPDLGNALTPMLVTFQITSYKAGQELTTHFTLAQKFKTPGWRYQLQMKSVMDSNDSGSFYTFVIDRSKPIPVKPEHVESIKYWAEVVTNHGESLTIDEEAAEPETAETSF